MSDNSWYEKGELPPVGSECIRSDNLVLIVAHMYNGKEKYAAFQYVDGNGCGYAEARFFRPIKTGRELAIEAAWNATNHLGYEHSAIKEIASELFKLGLLRSKNES